MFLCVLEFVREWVPVRICVRANLCKRVVLPLATSP